MANDRTLPLTSDPAETDALAQERLLAFEAFFDREKARLFRALCLVTRNRFEAEELTQREPPAGTRGRLGQAFGQRAVHGSVGVEVRMLGPRERDPRDRSFSG
jgi:hypothetical protein